MEDILIVLFVCVLLPVGIVLIVFLAAMNADNKRASILIKAIEAGNGMDVDKLAEALRKPRKSAREILNGRLLRGCIFSLIGLFLVGVGLANFLTGSEFGSDPVTVPMVFGGASAAVGISFLVVYFVTRKQVLGSSDKD